MAWGGDDSLQGRPDPAPDEPSSHAVNAPTLHTAAQRLNLGAPPDPAPGATPGVRVSDAIDATLRLASGHYENFPVLSRLVPPELRPDFAAVYAYCRTTDDLGDETGAGEAARARSLELLGRWRIMLDQCVAYARRAGSDAPTHPVMLALAGTIRRHDLPAEPFHHFIDAFEQDQRVTRYRTWDELLDYCTRSADPVGRIVLHLGGHRPGQGDWADLAAMSDATCTALQLTNFWQDVRRDLLDRDRVYLPSDETGLTAEDLRGHLDDSRLARGDDPEFRIRYIKAVRGLVHRTRDLFEKGRPLPARLGPTMGRVVWLFGAGGERVLDLIERRGCTTLWRRPRLSRTAKLLLIARASVLRPDAGASA